MTKTTTLVLEVDDQGAIQNLEEINNQLEEAGVNAKKFEDSLEAAGDEIDKTEGRIKVLGGAINILGGTAELAVGALATIGVPEESVERIEQLTLGTIALADGAKRTFEGFKELGEGIKAYGGIQKITTGITKAFGVALKVATGPVGLIIAGITALGAILFALRDKVEIVNKAFTFFGNLINKVGAALGFAKTESEKFQEAQAELAGELDFELKLLQAQGASIDELVKKERALLTAKLNATKKGTEERKKAEQDLALFEARVEREAQERREKAAEEARKKREEALEAELSRYAEILKESEKAIEDATKAVVDEVLEGILGGAKKAVEELPDLIIEEVDLEEVGEVGEEVGDTFVTGFDLSFRQGLKETNAKLKDFFKSETAAAIGTNLEAASQLTSALVEVTGEGSEEAFEKAKKFKIADVVTSSIQAAFQAFGAAQQFGPILGPILGAAQVAAIGVAANKAIQDIRSSTFDGGSGTTPSISAGGGGAPIATAGGILSTSGASGGGNTTTSTPITTAQEPVRAYVLVNDVNSAQEAGRAINRRRSLTG